ncbi:MAG: hypothetical protein ACRCZI_07575, partial [Cetobacterium sp.]
AFVELDRNIGLSTGWMSVVDFFDSNGSFQYGGYPVGDVRPLYSNVSVMGMTEYALYGQLSFNIQTDADFVVGQSGSPLFQLVNGLYEIVAVMGTMQVDRSEAAGGSSLRELFFNAVDLAKC